MSKPPIQAGFDYAQTLIELRKVFNYEEIAHRCGWDSKGSVTKVLKGAIPAHPQGEALYILYFETFGKKPHY